MLNLIGEGLAKGAKKALQETAEEVGEKASSKVAKKTVGSLTDDVVDSGAAVLGKLLGEGGEGILSKLGKKIPVSYTDDIAQDIAVKAPEMQKLYRGIKAETPEKLEKYIADMLDPTIKPRTYDGSAYGEGYYFTPFRDSAEGYASNDLSKPYQAVLEIEQPRNRFIGINKQNQNRPVDFVMRAEKRVGGGRAASVGERDFDNYLKKNGILGNRVNDNITVIKDNDAVKNMKVIGRRESGGVWDYNDALNSANIQKDLDKASPFLPRREKNIPVEMSSDYPNDFYRIPVRFTNKEADTLHRYTGKVPELYHQTTATSLGDMTLDRRQAISGDSGMPEGIFLKDTPRDIGLIGKNQLALDARMENPAYFKDRADLDNFMRSRGANDLMSRRKELDDYYQKLADEAEKKQHDLAMVAWDNPTPENKALAKQAMDDWQRITEEWTKAIDDNGDKAREGIRNTLVNNGYDSAIIENDAGSGGRSVKSYIVFDKNQLSPRYNKKMGFDPADANSIYSYSIGKQSEMKDMLNNIAKELDLSGSRYSVVADKNKSVDSMLKKVGRKQASGRDYRLMDMKDHVRGAFMVDDLTDRESIGEVMDAIQREVGSPVSVENVKSEMGYNGIHLTWRDENGIGYEVQITNPEVWKTKKASDKIYHKWRNVSPEELDSDPKKMLQYLNDERESKNLWGSLWKKLGFGNNAPDFSWAEDWLDDVSDMMG